MSDSERGRTDDRRGGGTEDEIGEEAAAEALKDRRRSKKVYLFRLRKGKKVLEWKRKEEKGVSIHYRGGRRWGSCLCVNQPWTIESAGESPTSDPNSPKFSFDMLRELIEKNDFHSKECNPHLDADEVITE